MPREAATLTARRVAALIWGLCVLIAVATLILLVIGPGRVLPSDIFAGVGGVSFLILALTFASVGAIVARRVPENTIGWIFLLTGLANSVQLLSWQYADVGLHATHRFAWRDRGGRLQHRDRRGDRGAARPLAAPVSRTGGSPRGGGGRRSGACSLGMTLLVLAGTLRPGRYAEPFATGVEPVRPRGRARGDGRGRPRRLAVRDRRDRARGGGDGRPPAASARRRASAAQARARRRLGRRGRGRSRS